jgi:TolB-like protein/Tfp pilus assembly protein PilF
VAHQEVIEFGDFRFEPATPLLTRNSRSIEVAPKALEILRVLVRNAGQVVSKDEILSLVWPDEFVEEGNLAVHISALRKALGQNDARSGYIETIPKRGYRFATPVSRPPSIAVLPFENLSPDADDEYFAQGLAEEIIIALSRISGLKVIARTSAFAFKGRNNDIRRIAETLGVAHILEGSVRRSGNRIRVIVQLIAAADGSHLWSERFDREVADVFEMQDEISVLIAGTLRGKLTAESEPRRRQLPKFAAYEALLRAWYYTWKFTPESLTRAAQSFEQAIAFDPQFALARSSYAEHLFILAHIGTEATHDVMPLMRDEARKALELDPSLPEAHAALGLVAATYDYDWKEAERRYARAMVDGAVSPLTRTLYANFYLLPLGRFEEAVKEGELALQSDPLHLGIRTELALFLAAAGEIAEAEMQIQQALDLDPNYFPAYHAATGVSTLQGRFAEALAHAEKAYSLCPWTFYSISPVAGLSARTGDQARAEEMLQLIRTGPPWLTNTALMYFCLAGGDVEGAADWAEKAIEDRVPCICSALRCAKDLRVSPRWPKLAKLMNLPETA